MFDEKKQVLEIINGFKNLSSKIRDENVQIKETLTKNETTISACKKEYQKLYQRYEIIQQENEELKQYIINLQQQLQQQPQFQTYQNNQRHQQQLKRRQSFQRIAQKHPEIIEKESLKKKLKRRYVVVDKENDNEYDDDFPYDADEDNNVEDAYDDNDQYEIVKIKKK